MPIIITLSIVLVLVLIALLISYIVYSITFKRSKKRPSGIPEKPGFENIKAELEFSRTQIINTPSVPHTITAEDGTKLFARFYSLYDSNAPIAIMMHGYHGSSARDFSKGFFIAKEKGMNVLLVDQRAHGKSGGRSITFGYKESRDLKAWCLHAKKLYPRSKIVIFGVSMGASSVLLASTLDLPKNVVGAVADCPFDSAEKILKKVLTDLHMPPKVVYPFMYLGARIFAGFDIKKANAFEVVDKCKIPMLIFHGKSDSLVPYQMSVRIYEKITTKKDIMVVDGAEHGLSCLVDPVGYMAKTDEFLDFVLGEDNDENK